MQAFAAHQPLTVMVDAVRTLTQGQAAEALLGHAAGFYVVQVPGLEGPQINLIESPIASAVVWEGQTCDHGGAWGAGLRLA